jgi:hypothetical protein
VLVEQQLAVEAHGEDAVAALDQLGPDGEALGDLGRQTGGARLVVSDDAVLDRQFRHSGPLLAADYRVG